MGNSLPPCLERTLSLPPLLRSGGEQGYSGSRESGGVFGECMLGVLVLLLGVVFCCVFFNLFFYHYYYFNFTAILKCQKIQEKTIISLKEQYLSSRLGNTCFSFQSIFNIMLYKYSKNCLSRTLEDSVLTKRAGCLVPSVVTASDGNATTGKFGAILSLL